MDIECKLHLEEGYTLSDIIAQLQHSTKIPLCVYDEKYVTLSPPDISNYKILSVSHDDTDIIRSRYLKDNGDVFSFFEVKSIGVTLEVEAPSRASKVSSDEVEAPSRISKAPSRISKAPSRVSKASPLDVEAPPRVSKITPLEVEAPSRVSKIPPRVSRAPPRVSKASPLEVEAPPRVSKASPPEIEAPPLEVEPPLRVSKVKPKGMKMKPGILPSKERRQSQSSDDMIGKVIDITLPQGNVSSENRGNTKRQTDVAISVSRTALTSKQKKKSLGH